MAETRPPQDLTLSAYSALQLCTSYDVCTSAPAAVQLPSANFEPLEGRKAKDGLGSEQRVEESESRVNRTVKAVSV